MDCNRSSPPAYISVQNALKDTGMGGGRSMVMREVGRVPGVGTRPAAPETFTVESVEAVDGLGADKGGPLCNPQTGPQRRRSTGNSLRGQRRSLARVRYNYGLAASDTAALNANIDRKRLAKPRW